MNHLCIMGPPRTGKTLICRALNMHENITSVMEPFFFYFKICRNIYYRALGHSNFDDNQPVSTHFCDDQFSVAQFNQYFSRLSFDDSDIQELIRLTTWQQETLINERGPALVPLLDQLKPDSAIGVLTQLVQITLQAYSKEKMKYIGFSEGWCDEFISPLMNMPSLPFRTIHAIRDPRSIVASRLYGSKIEENYDGSYPILFLIRHWRKSVAYSILNQSNPAYLMVMYENLVSSPKTWFEKICSHLDVPFSDKLMHPDHFVDGAGDIWRANTNHEKKKGFSTSSISKWKEIIPDDVIGFIEYLCYPELRYLGYDVTSGDIGLQELSSFSENEDKIVDWLKPYNLTINDEELKKEVVRRQLLDAPDLCENTLKSHYFIDPLVFDVLSGS